MGIKTKPLNTLGSCQSILRKYRARRTMELRWANCRSLGFNEWKKRVRKFIFEQLCYDPGPLHLKPKRGAQFKTDDFIAEKVTYNTAPWFTVPAYFLLPTKGKPPYPAVYLMHEWGGNVLFGKERVIQFGNEPPTLVDHQRTTYREGAPANALTKRGFAVLVADAFYFGERGPRDLPGIPKQINAHNLTVPEAYNLNARIRETLYSALRYLMWSGTTWAGINTWDDIRGIDYLASRPEVDAGRIACCGLSGGGWRTNLLAALDDRIRASASVMWMTTNDAQFEYNVCGAVGTFCLVPALWQKIDVPDLSVLAAPNATMVVSGTKDRLFPPEGTSKALRYIADGFAWAGCPDQFRAYTPPKKHCFDKEIYFKVIQWFEKHLKR